MEEKIILGKTWSLLILVMALFAAQAISSVSDNGTPSLTQSTELEYNSSRNVASK